jgi:ribose 5-phosphate isomerase B
MSIAANKVAGVRAALCWSETAARLSRQHNDANVLCVGARLTGPGVIEEMARIFLETRFEGGRHQRRVDKMTDLD